MEAALIVLGAAFVALAFALAKERRSRRADADRFHRELSEQRSRREAELKEQSERTAALFDRMVEGLIIIDAAGRIRLANRAAARLFGFDGPAAGKSILETTRHHEVAAVVGRLSREPEVLDHELRIDSIGAPRFLQVNALALRDSAGANNGAILVFHDLTRLRQLEGVRQEFVANVSHELRTPLSLIKSAAETLLDGAIDDLQPRAQARSVTLENSIPGAIVALADHERMRQVIFNLLDNAIKYGRVGGKTVIGGRVLPNGRIEISVVDDGPGIPKESHERIFERFYRVDKARSREQGGTGLGLAIVKHVIQAHGGEVRLESEPGSGSSFIFWLPPASPPNGV